jgi:hypothetical protein
MNAASTLTAKAIALALGGALSTLGLSLTANAAAATTTTAPTLGYATVDMGALASHPLAGTYLNPPTGATTFSSVPFNLANIALITSGSHMPLTSTVHKPLSVSVLMNSAYGYNYYKNQVVGRVHLTFSDGTSQDTDLVAGGQIREWWLNSGYLIDTLSSPAAKQVWSGQGQVGTGAGTAVIDMLTVTVAPTTADLTGISVSDNANSPFDIMVSGVTVAYDATPKPTRPGNSGNTPAAQNSQAQQHANSANFTGQSPAQGKSAASANAGLATPAISNASPAATETDKHTNRSHR